jgi:MoxR-like ATPase
MSIADSAARIRANIERVIVGKSDAINLMLVAILCEGHVLIEDVPGIGKTTLAKALACSIDCAFRRVQCTPDLLPSDITGTYFFNQRIQEFEYRAGPVVTNILLADELNRATPRTQSSLLECMQERQVTVDGETRPLPRPFLVIATQNPVELEGTFPLPEAQLDRFLLKIRLGYPTLEEEEHITRCFEEESPIDSLQPVSSATELLMWQRECRRIHVADAVRQYAVQLVRMTRDLPSVQLGASPRATLGILGAAQALAAIEGRSFVIPDDLKRLAVPVLSHRLILKPEARLRGRGCEDVVEDVLATVPVPVEDLV